METDESTECVGFVECPCRRCRGLRFSASDAHNKGREHDTAYCEPCRRSRREEASAAYGR